MTVFKTSGWSLTVLWLTAFMVASTITLADDINTIPQRQDIDDMYKWRVDDIYGTIEEWEADYKKVEGGITELEKFKGHLGDSPEMLLKCLKLDDELNILNSNLYVFANLKLDEDQRVSTYQELSGRAAAMNGRLAAAEAFIRPEILSLDERTVGNFLNSNEELNLYRFHIENIMREKAHVLSPEGEEIMAMADPLFRSYLRIFNMIDNADHKLGTIEDKEGNKIELTYGRYRNVMRDTVREIRRIANDTVQESWKRYINTLATTFNSSIQKDLFITKVRNYNSTLERKLFDYNIPVKVYENLVNTVNANLEPYHKWHTIRKKHFGFDTMYTYDMALPVAPEFEKKYSYEEVKDIVLKGLEPLGEEYLEAVKMGLRSGWIDVYETEGKRSGGYEWGTYTSHPYILMNFDSTLNSLSTLAHELGHALNDYYVNASEPLIYSDYSLFTAEVASTCNEALLLRYLIDNAESKEEKIVLLEHYIRQIDGSFFTQTMFSDFEKVIHDHVQNGGATSVDYFRETYRDIFQNYIGPDVFIGPDNDMGCMKIMHFYRTFYVYQYATGYAAAQALSQKILDGDPKAIKAYIQFLKTGSSKYPMDMLKDAGVDLTSPEPFVAAVQVFSDLVDQLEKLLQES